MAVYYISACHDCKEQVMWTKCPEETALSWHKEFHPVHNTELGDDLDDDFHGRVWRYKGPVAVDLDEWKEIQKNKE